MVVLWFLVVHTELILNPVFSLSSLKLHHRARNLAMLSANFKLVDKGGSAVRLAPSCP